jgi:hypothetical protein
VSDHDLWDDYDDELADYPRAAGKIGGLFRAIWSLALVQVIAAAIGVMVAIGKQVSFWVDNEYRNLWRTEHCLVFAISVVGACVNGFVMCGAARTLRTQDYRRSLLVAGLSAISLPFFHLAVASIPLSILAWRELRKPHVRDRFAALARDTIESAPEELPDARTDRTP